MLRLIITEDIKNKLIAHAEAEAPIEACGYIAGKKQEETVFAEEIFHLTNIDKSEEHFSFDPAEQFNAAKNARKKNLEIIAVYHSHPASPARPSQEDIKLAFDPNIIYVIISLLSDTNTIKAFRIIKSNVEELLIEIK